MKFAYLSEAFVIGVTGKDCMRYLNARLTNNIKSLKPNTAILSAALTATGKTEGLFSVLKEDDTSFILVSDGGEKVEVLSALKKFIVADRVNVEILDLCVLHVFDTLEVQSNSIFKKIIPIKKGKIQGYDCLVSKDQLDPAIKILAESGSHVELKDYHVNRILGGVPSFPIEISPSTLFIESGYTEAISFTKGCYVGQEVVEKVASMGKTSKKHIRCRFPQFFKIGEAVCAEGIIIGQIINSFDDGKDGSIVVARVNNDGTVFKTITCNEILGELIVPEVIV